MQNSNKVPPQHPASDATTEIRLLRLADLPAYHEHLLRHEQENGRNGDIVFAPYEEPRNPILEQISTEKQAKWTAPVTDLAWERCWGIMEDAKIYGDLKLIPSLPLLSARHRATLMIGIERSHRGRGLGAKLISTALKWAYQQPTLEWISLQVFEHNLPARSLYAKFGFQEIGRTPDLFRVQGQKITDIEMALNIRDRPILALDSDQNP
jgi:RimJ/RimL family protein N-acetyltransferase